MLGKMWQIWWHKKFGDFMLQNAITRENARACACASFFAKCLKWHETYTKKIWDDFEHFYFLRARAFFDLKLTGRILTLIMLNMSKKCLSVMKIWSWVESTKKKHKMAPGWRHEDLMTLKMFVSRLMTMTYDCAKIERNWPNWSWVILYTKKCGEIKIN